MDLEKDYYQVLGVTETAEPAVIRAVYRALAMLYHPDRNIGNEAESNNKMSEINEAFNVLSNELTRTEYDSKRAEYNNFFSFKNESNEEKEAPKTDPLHADWEIAQFHYPDLELILKKLNMISWKIAYGYKAYLLESKKFSQRLEIAHHIEKEYMCKYFGDSNLIHEFAKYLIKNDRLDIARFLNRAIKSLGDEIDAEKLIEQIENKFEFGDGYESNIAKEYKSYMRSNQDADNKSTNSGFYIVFLLFIFFILNLILSQ